MTENGRLFVNVAASYGRSLVALVCGLFTGRWILMALGQSDYGLYGVIGGLTIFIDFFNMLLADAVARFYGVAVGRAAVAQDSAAALEDCRRWFNVALLLHTLLPLTLMAVGYPLGVWAVTHWLEVPPDRLEACVWVFRFLCVSCFVSMVNAPFRALFIAKQRLAELNLYTFLQTVANFCFVLWMVTRPPDYGPWLVPFAAWIMVIRVLPELAMVLRAACAFPECRLRLGTLCLRGQTRMNLVFVEKLPVCVRIVDALRSAGQPAQRVQLALEALNITPRNGHLGHPLDGALGAADQVVLRAEDLLPELQHPPRIGSGRRRIPLVPHGLQYLTVDIPAVEPGHIEGRLHPGRGLRHAAQFAEDARAEEPVDKTHGRLHLPGCRLLHPAFGMPLGISIHEERVQGQHAVNRMGGIPG